MKSRYLLALFFAMIPVFVIPALAQEDVEIPTWVKGVANFWVEDKIDDGEFATALEFLIDSNIIQLGNNTIVSEQENLSDNERTLLELQISDRDRTIKDLEETITEIGLNNTQLQTSVTEKTGLYDQIKEDFKQYKQNYPLKIGNIGGKLVVDYIEELEAEIKELKGN